MISPVFVVILLVGIAFLLFCLFHLLREIRRSKRVAITPLSRQRGAGVSFPLFVLKKNDYSMFEVETPERILSHMKPLDIENGEYLCWDARGRAARISISGQRVTGIALTKAVISLGDAFRLYSDVHGLDVDTTGPFELVWCRLRQEVRQSHRRGA